MRLLLPSAKLPSAFHEIVIRSFRTVCIATWIVASSFANARVSTLRPCGGIGRLAMCRRNKSISVVSLSAASKMRVNSFCASMLSILFVFCHGAEMMPHLDLFRPVAIRQHAEGSIVSSNCQIAESSAPPGAGAARHRFRRQVCRKFSHKSRRGESRTPARHRFLFAPCRAPGPSR